MAKFSEMSPARGRGRGNSNSGGGRRRRRNRTDLTSEESWQTNTNLERR